MEYTYTGHGISLTRSARPAYLLIGLITITGLFMYSDGWTTITKWFLASTVLVLIFCIWFPYSPFVKVLVEINGDKIKIGNITLTTNELIKIVNQKEGLTIQFHQLNTEEPVQIRMDDGYQKTASTFLKKWAIDYGIPYYDED